MEPGEVYEVTLQPLTTSNYFDVGHRLRIESVEQQTSRVSTET